MVELKAPVFNVDPFDKDVHQRTEGLRISYFLMRIFCAPTWKFGCRLFKVGHRIYWAGLLNPFLLQIKARRIYQPLQVWQVRHIPIQLP